MVQNPGHRKIGNDNERRTAFLTVFGYHWPPRAVEMPRVFKAFAIDCSVVAPARRIPSTTPPICAIISGGVGASHDNPVYKRDRRPGREAARIQNYLMVPCFRE